MTGENIINSGYGFACRINNIKESGKGNVVISGCAVTEKSTPDMSVDVAAGVIQIAGSLISVSGVNKAVDAAHATLDRYDVIQVGSNGTVDYVAGTAASKPYPADLSEVHVLLAIVFVEHASTVVNTADINDSRIAGVAMGNVPIGAILSWAKSLTGVPALPSNFVECNGQTLSDANSLLNGVVIPNLNTGTYKMLRGASTSGGTGGADTRDISHYHSVELPDGGLHGVGGGSESIVHPQSVNSGSAGSATQSFLPAYYEVVWIIRVK